MKRRVVLFDQKFINQTWETALQVVKFYNRSELRNNVKKLTFWTVVLRQSECMGYK